MSARKSSHRTIFLIVSSGSPLALIASSLRSTSKNPFCPMTRSLHPPISACAHRVRFVGTWREEFFEAPYGPYQFPEKLISASITKGLLGKAIPVYGAGLNVRDWLFVDDHVKALALVLEHGRPGETYNIGGGAQRRNIDVVLAICDTLDLLKPGNKAGSHRKLITYVDDRPGHDYRYA